MEDLRVLVISDSPVRVNYLSQHVRLQKMKPVRYPNNGATMHAMKVDSFFMVVVDLTLPIDQKLALLKAACVLQKDARCIAIGKSAYLEKTNLIKEFPAIVRLPHMDRFPEELAAQKPAESP